MSLQITWPFNAGSSSTLPLALSADGLLSDAMRTLPSLPKSLLLSALLHTVVLALLWPIHLAIPKPPPPEKGITKNFVELELATATATANTSAAHNEQPAARPRTVGVRPTKKTSSTQKLISLLKTPYNSARPNPALGNDPAAGLAPGGAERWHEAGYTTKDDPAIAWGAGSGTFERVQDLVLMSLLQKKVDALLFYPGVLARRNISGTVNTRIVLDEHGSCDWRRTLIRAADPHLRVYILHLLKKVCSENFKRYTKERLMTNIDMSFKFEISEDRTSEDLIAKHQSVLGNVLIFYRHSRHSIAEWRLGPLTGVFPIPFVGFDFDWVVENFDTYMNEKDPLGEFRSGPDPEP